MKLDLRLILIFTSFFSTKVLRLSIHISYLLVDFHFLSTVYSYLFILYIGFVIFLFFKLRCKIAIQHYIKMYNIIIQHLYVLQNDHHISLGNIIIIHSYNFFLVMETFKINSLGNCQLYSAVS